MLCQGVSRAYQQGERRTDVLREFSAEFAAGTSTALLGRSGTGKSTLLNLIAGLDDVDSGTIRLGDVAMTAIQEPEKTRFRRRSIGFVYQTFNLLPTLSVAGNILLVIELNGTKGAPARRRVAELLDAVDLAGAGERYPDTLSGGEQQRVALARALAHRPPLILADEPTGNLDATNADRCAELLMDRVRADNVTLIVATHSRRLAANCDQVIDLGDGLS